MHLRLLEPGDVAGLVRLWPAATRPGAALHPTLERAISTGRAFGACIVADSSNTPLAYGLSTFVRPAWIRAYHRSPRQALAVALLEAERDTQATMLDPEEVAAANTGDEGLHAVVLCYCQRHLDPADPLTHETLAIGHAGHRQAHAGYHLQAIWQEASSREEEAFLTAGGMRRLPAPSARAPRRALFGFTREDAGGDWVSHPVSFLFTERTTRLGLTAAQRRIASLALWLLRDEQIAERLGLSLDTVHKQWRQMFVRAEATMPSALGPAPGDGRTGRGPEKRRHLLEYLRNNLHEVRPIVGRRARRG